MTVENRIFTFVCALVVSLGAVAESAGAGVPGAPLAVTHSCQSGTLPGQGESSEEEEEPDCD